jgi:uncharacterized membrane protein YgdD (TMEM256/DUF423 family)
VNVSSLILGLGAASGAVSVALGALAAHALKARLDAAALSAFQTGVEYQFFHSLALCAVAVWLRGAAPGDQGATLFAGCAFVVGILFFSGSLYGLAFDGPRWLGPVTPLGGLAFIAGWSALAYEGFRRAFAA